MISEAKKSHEFIAIVNFEMKNNKPLITLNGVHE